MTVIACIIIIRYKLIWLFSRTDIHFKICFKSLILPVLNIVINYVICCSYTDLEQQLHNPINIFVLKLIFILVVLNRLNSLHTTLPVMLKVI